METITPALAQYPAEKNKVLAKEFRPSTNFYTSDLIFRNYLSRNISREGYTTMKERLEYTGAQAAGPMNELSMLADHHGPVLVKRNALGETINDIRFHPAYKELTDIALKSGMFRVKWEPASAKRFSREKHRLGFSVGYLFAMSEAGLYCPLCMTDGVARLIDLFGEEEDKARLLPHIYTNMVEELFTGAMYLTEKTGGSDVGANITTATSTKGKHYLLNGEKWFCSNANAELIFALARTDADIKGTKGLSIFLVEKNLPEGERNPIDIIRLKDKLGVRAMASAECMLQDAEGKLVGNEFEGFKVMVEMINLSRLYNSVTALSISRRALIEAYQFLMHRNLFGKNALQHALVRTKLTELGSLNVANFYLVWRAIRSLDLADNGDEREAQLFRIINPMAKKWSAETGVYITRESMELMGGLGYIEDMVMPKLMRDVMVLPIWEGSGNVIILDMLRALHKSEGFEVLCEEIINAAAKNEEYGLFLRTELDLLKRFAAELKTLPKQEAEASARLFFEKVITLYQMALLMEELNPESNAWILPALVYLKEKYAPSATLQATKPLTVEEVAGLIAWKA